MHSGSNTAAVRVMITIYIIDIFITGLSFLVLNKIVGADGVNF